MKGHSKDSNNMKKPTGVQESILQELSARQCSAIELMESGVSRNRSNLGAQLRLMFAYGWIQESKRPPKYDVRGQARKYYIITSEGKKALRNA